MTRRRWIGLALVLGGLGMMTAAGLLGYTIYRRVETRTVLAGDVIAMDGTLTETLEREETDSIIRVSVPLYLARYAYPNADGVMRTGEQAITGREYRTLPGEGEPVTVYIDLADPRVTGVERGVGFPGVAGLRVVIMLAVLGASAGLVGAGVRMLAAPPV